MLNLWTRFRGFSLIEILIVVSILGILLSISLPRFSSSKAFIGNEVISENIYSLLQLLGQQSSTILEPMIVTLNLGEENFVESLETFYYKVNGSKVPKLFVSENGLRINVFPIIDKIVFNNGDWEFYLRENLVSTNMIEFLFNINENQARIMMNKNSKRIIYQ